MIERPGLNISGGILTHAKFRAVRTAFVCGERRVTWAKFDRRVSKVVFRDEEFPRNALGKLLKRQLREPYWK